MRKALVMVGVMLAGTAWGQALPARVSWVGNSFNGKDGWVLQDVEDICVTPDGTLFTNVGWDEAGGNVQEYREGRLVRVAGHTHGWGYEGGQAVAANARYVFIAQGVDNEGGGLKGSSWPAKGLVWSGVSRRLREDIRKPAAFPGGRGKEGDVLPGAFLPVVEVVAGMKQGSIRGLAASNGELFISCPHDGVVRVYDAETMKAVRSWKVERPDKVCLDPQGRLWVAQRPTEAGGDWTIRRYTAGGKELPQLVRPGRGVVVGDLCADRQGRLLVADEGIDQDVKIFEGLDGSPRRAGTFGERGGILAPPAGRFGDRRFNRPRGVGVDDAGNLYVASSGSSALETGGGGSTVLECYGPEGGLKWRRLGLNFIDCADLDPAADTDLYTKEERFALDYTREAGQEWAYRAYTVNKFKYPDDPRLHIWSANAWLKRLQGQRVLFVSDMTGEFLQVYRFRPETDGEIAVPCGLFGRRRARQQGDWPPHQPEKGAWIWRDKSGDGRMDAGEFEAAGPEGGGHLVPDEAGNLWQAHGAAIRCVPFKGLDSHGVPEWEPSRTRTWPRPAEFDEVRRLRFLPGRDVLLAGGNKGQDKNQHWKPMGPVLCRYDGWAGGKPTLRWRVVLPFARGSKGHESAEPISFDVAGDYVFVAYTRGLAEDGVKWAYVKVYRLEDGQPVGFLSSEKELGEIGLLDIVESVRAVRRQDGEYGVFLEDDYKAKVVLFRWRP